MALAAKENPAERQTSKAALASSGSGRRGVDDDDDDNEGAMFPPPFPPLPLPPASCFVMRVTFFRNASSLSPSRRAA